MDRLISWDQELFFHINQGMANPFFDWLMPVFRNPFVWAPVYMFFAAFFVYNFRPKGLYVLLFGLLTIAFSDQISSHLLKLLIARDRPCNDPNMAMYVRLLIPCGAGYSFPSSHACNHFAFSVFLITVMPLRMRWVLPVAILWAAGVSFAQVYVGVHYPMDVLGGAIIGSLIGTFTGSMCVKVLRLNFDRTPDEEEVVSNEPPDEEIG